MQNIDTYYHPNPPVVGASLTIHLNGVVSEYNTRVHWYASNLV